MVITLMITAIITHIAMDEAAPQVLPLFVWLSPSFPVGSFAYSHGLEWAIETGAIRDATSLAGWIDPFFDHGVLHNEAVLLNLGWRSARHGDTRAFADLNTLALALCPSRELHLETSQQGAAFLAAASAAWPFAALPSFQSCLDEEIAYPLAVALFAAGHGIAQQPLTEVFLMAFCGNLVSAAQKLAIVGQSEAQQMLAGWRTKIDALARFAVDAEESALGTCAYSADIASMKHETQYSRLFRS
ncbi:urease accessory protein UreF [Beijerinckia mobilis]|uniref:urease accessory protein UreF n=1 Tax=Beijerinckia mobilis TaxID=231434 RepID=UPI00146FE85E|nr:urease accessory UreF family protein [Beijerinckia mobilis]